MKKQVVSLALVLILVLSLIPAAFAVGTEVNAYWHNFRNSDVNMALTDAKTPVSAETTVLKWAKKLGTGWSASPSIQIIVDDALIVMSGNKNLYKLDLQTGEILQECVMTAAPNFGYTPPTYAEGLIFCPLSGGIIQAFDADTLESVWIFKDEKGGQSLSPITYNDGCVYTGFWNGENKDANYVCVNVSDGSLKWNKSVPGGFYWAGSVVLGDAVIVGTDDGDSGYSGDSKLYSLNKKDGSVISVLTLAGCGDQRSSIAYSEAKGRIYFTAKNGYLCSAEVDVATGEVSDLLTSKQANQCTSTPVVYGDQVYFSCGSGVVVGSGGSGNFVVADADTLEQHYVMAMKAYPQGSVLVSEAYLAETGKLYCYSTYNGYPGGLTLIKVDPTVNTAEGAELIEIFTPADEYQQYCITSPICGPDGTIYYKNDSGNVLAVGTNNAYLSNLTADVGSFTEPFVGSQMSHELVVPQGTESVTLTPTACKGGAAEAVTVTLADGIANAEITVTKDGDSRTYTVSIREIYSDTTLSELKVNESNSYTGKAAALSPEFAADVCYYSMLTAGENRSFVNVWPTASDSHATVKVYPLTNAQGKNESDIGEDGAFEVTATNRGHDRYAVYFVDDTKAMAVRIEVIAENGEVTNYYLVISKEAAEDGNALLESLENCAHDDCTVTGIQEATCSAPGYTGDKVCNYCGQRIAGQETEMLPHNYVVTSIAPTCTDYGYDLFLCTGCTASYTNNFVDALGHDWTDATCTAAKTCKVCGTTAGNAAEHDWLDATCTTAKTCKVCGVTEGDPSEHSWDEGVVTAEPTEEADGQRLFTCLLCGQSRTETIPSLDHAHNYTTEVTAPTCVAVGYTTYTCACGNSYTADEVDALGHDFQTGTCVRCGEADPNYKTAEGEVEIFVTIANKGNVVMFQQLIPVVDVNHNGIFDVDDALYAAHEAGFDGGAAAGYSSYESQWGLSIGMLWGDTSYCYGYWLNNASCWSLEDVVADGNHLVAFVCTDGEFWSDAYSKFDAFDYTTTTAEDLVVKLEKAGYDENWNTVFSAHAGATITVYDSEGKALTTGYTVTDNGDGSYAIRITAAGSYYVAATDADPLTVPAVCQVTVTYVEQVPPTGDHSMISLVVAAMSISMLAVLCIGKKRAF